MIELQQKHAKITDQTFPPADQSTPIKIVEEIVNNIPYSILKNPNSKFLDPCAGMGTYGVVLHKKLLEYHNSNHILNNMIYLLEIKEYKCEYLNLFGFKNIYNNNFLTHDFNNMKFDVILGNYPFNDGVGMETKGLNGAKQGKTNLYKEFIAHSKTVIKPTGIIAVIAPPGAFKSFLDNSLNIQKYYFNNKRCWIKLISTVSWFCSLDPEVKLGSVPTTIQDKLFTNDHTKIRQRASKKEHSYYLYNYIKPLKIHNNEEKDRLSIKEQGKYCPPITLTDSEINKTNLHFLLNYLLDYLDNHAAQWHSFNKRLKYEWLEGLDYLITEDDIIKQYKLTQEDINVLNTSK
tara:strand:+ start:27 stop:1067 length:1041 start_codon:yes stop_codon:yes gene_type:complete